MNNEQIISQQIQWWLTQEASLMTKLTVDLQTRFKSLPVTDLLLRECLKFLFIAGSVKQGEGRETFTPSVIVDEIWHCLILHTQSYSLFCQRFYGHFIHHHPGGDKQDNLRQLQKTMYALQRHFGSLEPTVWPTDAVLDITGQCSSCDT